MTFPDLLLFITTAGYKCPVVLHTLSAGTNNYQTTSACGWSVVMLRYNRLDSTFNWTRNWNGYKNGFGSPYDTDFWLGLEPLHRITSAGNYRLRVEVQRMDFASAMNEALWHSGEYWQFSIGDELTSKYAISVSGWVGDGTALDSFNPPAPYGNATQNGQKFSTYDVDNDNYDGPDFDGSCSRMYGGVGWWFANSSSYCFWNLLTTDKLSDNVWGYYYNREKTRIPTHFIRWMIKPQ